MKKFLTFIIASLIVFTSFINIHADDFSYDEHIVLGENESIILDSEEKIELENDLNQIKDNYNIDIYFIFDSLISDEEFDAYLESFENQSVDDENNVLLLINKNYWQIEAVGPNQDIVNNNVQEIYSSFVNDFQIDYKDGIITYYQKVVSLINNLNYTSSVDKVSGRPQIVDFADLLSSSEEEELIDLFSQVYTKQGIYLVGVITNSINGLSPMQYADDFLDYNNYPSNSCLLLVSMEDRDWYISTTGNAIDILNDEDIYRIGDFVVDELANEDYYSAFSVFAKKVSDDISNYNNPSYNPDTNTSQTFTIKNIWIGLGIGLFVTLITMLILRGQLKSVRTKHFASDYIVKNSFAITGYADMFLNKHVTRTAKPKDNDSSSGGGGSFHTSSSGISHGGGGGKF